MPYNAVCWASNEMDETKRETEMCCSDEERNPHDLIFLRASIDSLRLMGFKAVFDYYEGLESPRSSYLETVKCCTMQFAGLQTRWTQLNERLTRAATTKKGTNMT